MKYFTPERFLRLQDRNSEQEFRTAIHAWEEAAEEYGRYLRETTPQLPPDVRRLVEQGSLHDARVAGLWQAHTRLTIVLQRESDASRLCVLTYHLVDSPCIDPAALPEMHRSAQAAWLYDEIGVDREARFDATAGIQYRAGSQAATNGGQQRGVAVFTHDILLSNGWELRLRFHRLHVARPTALLCQDGRGRATAREASTSR